MKKWLREDRSTLKQMCRLCKRQGLTEETLKREFCPMCRVATIRKRFAEKTGIYKEESE